MGNLNSIFNSPSAAEMGVEPDLKYQEMEQLDMDPTVTHFGSEWSAMESLQYLRADILKAGGMTKDFAMEALNQLPTFGNGDSVNHYTDYPSATKYRTSLEAISLGIAAILAAATAALAFLTYKIIRWMMGGDEASDKAISAGEINTKTASTIEDIKDTGDELNQLESNMSDMERAIGSGYEVIDEGKPYQFKSLDDMVKHMADRNDSIPTPEKFLSEQNGMYNDIMNGGVFTKEMQMFGPSTVEAAGRLDKRVKDLSFFVKKVVEPGPKDAGFHANLKKVADNRITVKYSTGKSGTLDEHKQYLLSLRSDVESNTTPMRFGYKALLQRCAIVANDKSFINTVQTYGSIGAGLLECETSIAALADHLKGYKNAKSEDVTHPDNDSFLLVKAIVRECQSDLVAMQGIVSVLRTYASVRVHVSDSIKGYVDKVNRENLRLIGTTKADIPAAVAKAAKDAAAIVEESNTRTKGGFFRRLFKRK